jgi:hypothetical protein
LVGFGKASYHIKNVNCFNETDTLSLDEVYLPTKDSYLLYGYGGPFNEYNFGKFNGGTGCIDAIKHDDNDPFYNKKPAGDYQYNLKVKRNGITTEKTIYKTILQDQDNLVEIFY